MLRELVSEARVLAGAGLLQLALPRPRLFRELTGLPRGGLHLGVMLGANAGLRPHDTALVDERGRLTWQQLDARVSRLANVLRARLSEGDRVAFMLRNGRESVECYAACGRAGMVPIPLNAWFAPADIESVRDQHAPGLTIADPEFEEVLSRAGVSEVLWVGHEPDYEAALAEASARAPRARGAGRLITLTSGTTGPPKAAERSMQGPLHLVTDLLRRTGLRQGDPFIVAPPLFHAWGFGMAGLSLLLGGPLVLRRRFDPEDFLATVTREHVAAACLVPVMVRRLLEDVENHPPTPSWRVALVSGSAFPVPLREEAERRFGPIFYNLYGATEIGWAAMATPRDQAERPGTVGRPSTGSRVFAVDEHGRHLGPGEVGKLYAQTGAEIEGYTGRELDRTILDGAMEFGDSGYVDDQGYVYVTGRTDEMIVSGGENIYPSEVEAALIDHPQVADAAVVGAADEEYGQVLRAFIVTREPGLSEDALRDFLRERVARYKVPKRFAFVDELPRNALGKVVKRALQADHP